MGSIKCVQRNRQPERCFVGISAIFENSCSRLLFEKLNLRSTQASQMLEVWYRQYMLRHSSKCGVQVSRGLLFCKYAAHRLCKNSSSFHGAMLRSCSEWPECPPTFPCAHPLTQRPIDPRQLLVVSSPGFLRLWQLGFGSPNGDQSL